MPDMTMGASVLASPARSAEIKDLAAALAKAQGAMGAAEKSGTNPAFKRDGKASTYATLTDVWNAVRKPLAANGLSIRQSPRTANGGVEVETELLHESGQYIRDTLWLPCPTMTVHTVGSMITYLRRYTLMSIAGIAPDDDDGNLAADAHKPGAPGSAGAGGDFRPAGPRKFTGRSWTDDEPHLVDNGREKGTLPAKPANGEGFVQTNGNAVRRIAWCRDAAELLKSANTKDELSAWWEANADRLGVIETALPQEHERLIVAFDDAMTRVLARAGT